MAVDEVAEAAEEEVEETIPEEANGEEMEEDESGNGDDNNNDQEISNDDGSESSSLGSISGDVAEEQEDMGTSPSPNKKKDMHLRSGKRKRRRSKETSGLTPPPDTVSARKRPRRGSPARESAKKGTVEDKNSDTVAVAETIAEETTQPAEEIAPPRKARDSILQSDKPALSAANQESEIPDPLEKDDGRRLFDAKPPAMPTATAATSESLLPAPVVQQQQQQQKQQQKQATQEQTEVVAPEELEEPPPSEFKIPPKAMMGPVVVFYILLIVLSGRIWIPLAGKLALSIIPLNEEALLPPVVMEEEVVVDADPDSPHQVPAVIWNGLAELEKAQVTIGSSSEDLSAYKADMAALIKMVRKHADVSKRKLMIRFGGLVEAEKILQTALKESDASPKVWKDAKDAMAALGLPNQKLLDTSLIDMWQVADPIECPEDPEIDGGAEVEVMENKDPPISPRIFESTETNLLLRATMTAEKIVRSAEAEVNIRNWVREKIDTAIEDEDEILAALEQIQAMSSDDDDTNTLSIEMVGALLQERLELEMADGTGEFDHAALMSGAKIIYGGKRGTTKSITDSLPLANRLMQLASLRFYGHGPEAAITPTYPKNSLGQCWSFQALPVKEQLKINQQDDHKHGSFGTLTISFAKPVQIENISIEHPTVTDHPKSAIRGFRIIGYGDALAEGSGQPMGSFQYRMGGASIQKFPVADKGPMQSVSLAIDSNWGLEYACLYRFRVHGVAVVED
ncbi:MAG: hypothetical protein SGBAC_010943 [Bacillariaceae sp.]